ncbi:MAG: NAD(P)H-hydrate dehydratase [Bdellovibrionaceae bacterium]|nr:NAD(P)H-hydrate dehydratase [Pseudobdellovibrionaceae bacterium]
MRLARQAEILEIDRLSASRFGLASAQLMENAGRAMAAEIGRWPGLRPSHRIVVLCGPGNNGGDGRVIARVLREKGFSRVEDFSFPRDFTAAESDLNSADLIVDALFGVGLNRPLGAEWSSLIESVRRSRRPVIAVDVPSGLDADRGVPLGAAVKARWTLTCGLAKPGLFLQEGPGLCGKIKIVDVGFPRELLAEIASSCFLVGRSTARRLWPKRRAMANKSHFGRLLVLGGSPGMEGAAVLSATAGARAGAGYVLLSSPATIPFDRKPPDFLFHDFNRALRGDWGRARAVVLGPGLGVNVKTKDLLLRLKNSHPRVLVDADALTVCAEERLWPLPPEWLVTPHAGELSRFLKIPSTAIEEDRLGAARRASRMLGCRVLLKGFRTVIDDGRRSFIIHSGNSALAKAGSGDVLAGFIGGLWAQGLGVEEGAALGAYLHGAIADEWVKSGKPAMSLMASDLPRLLGGVMKRVQDRDCGSF